MAEAIATKKRNFYKSLDAFNNPNSSSTSVATEPAPKRPRRNLSAASVASRHTTATANRPATAAKPNHSPKPPPAFSPWSQDTFLTRLRTFSRVSLWHPKPQTISEVKWAKRGWSCVDVNTVACKGCCGKRVVVSLDFAKTESVNRGEGVERDGDNGDAQETAEQDEDELEAALALKYQALIVDGHSDTCPWRRTGCPDDIYRLQVIRAASWQPELRRRYQSLHQISDAIRDVTLRGGSSQDKQSLIPIDQLLADLPADVLGPPGEEQPAPEDSLKALEIAMHGWTGSEDSGNELLHCDACFQRIGLWMYQPGYKPARSGSDDDDDDQTAIVDLVELHREHCPWRNPDSQCALGTLRGLNACQVLQTCVSAFVKDERRREERQRRSVHHQQPETNEDDDAEENERTAPPPSPAPSRDEIEKQDKERESRLKRLKSLFTIKKRKNPVVAPAPTNAKPLLARRG
ncbi:zf-C3HC-domain-containing protein [Hortaea werneckii]|nr:zf-C3HC-domain-containing protein [Hortaea werneckii]